jgi:hypothetical protein
MHRIYLAFLCFFRILFGKQLPQEVLPPAEAAPEPPKQLPAPEKPEKKKAAAAADGAPGALQLLALLQREGRLVDFLSESIDSFDDAAIGAAVRDIHRGCKKVLEQYFGFEPVVTGGENENITVEEGFDAARIRLVGNVGKPPFKGVLRHHGWRAAKTTLPTMSDGHDPSIVAPAEVELP